MLIGERPGDVEDLSGHPFAGPAGKLLDRCLAEAGIDRARTYITNVVKHFKWVPRGPRRVTRDRGRLVPSGLAPYALATVHPSALLRAPTSKRAIAKPSDSLWI